MIDKHMLWIWSWFVIGQVLNILKRAYFKVTGPDNAVAGYQAFFAQNWPALIFRGFAGALIYWLTFYPATLGTVAGWFGWHSSIPNLPEIAPVACIAGISSDAALDWIATKIPFLKGELPSFATGIKTTVVEKKTTETTTTTPLINAQDKPLDHDTMPEVGNKKTTTKENV